MKIEGNRVPDFLDRGGVLRTVHRKPPRMSQADYLNAKHGVNPNYDSPNDQFDRVITVEEPADGVVNDYSREAMSDSAFNRRLEGDSEPVKVGFSEADYGVW